MQVDKALPQSFDPDVADDGGLAPRKLTDPYDKDARFKAIVHSDELRALAAREGPGRLSALRVFHSKSVLCGGLCECRALNRPKRRFSARAARAARRGERPGRAEDAAAAHLRRAGAYPSSRAQILPDAPSGC